MTTKQVDRLVSMANQIAMNLGAGHDDSAAQRTADHICRFWTPAMRKQLVEFWRDGGDVTPQVADCLALLDKTDRNRSEST